LDDPSDRSYIAYAAQAGSWALVGIELEPGRAEATGRRFGVEVVVSDAVSPGVRGSFDVITMWHVLEHLPDPRAALDRAASLLRPGGTVIVSVPNNDSLQARLGGDTWLHLDIARHICHFNPGSLSQLVEHAGLEVERIGRFYPETEILGVIQTILNRLGVEPNLLYRFAKRDRTVVLRSGVLLSVAVAAATLPLALSWDILAPLLRTGASIQLVARRPA
jgi:SAM-dependent methyltransferase